MAESTNKAQVRSTPATPMNRIDQLLQDEAVRRGYRFEISDDGEEHRLIRPDGSVAMIARLR